MALQITPLEKYLIDSPPGPLRQDGSDKFWGLENVSLTSQFNTAKTYSQAKSQFGNTWYAGALCFQKRMIRLHNSAIAIQFYNVYTTQYLSENKSSITQAEPHSTQSQRLLQDKQE